MGRKVDVSELSPEEQKVILEVIQRDFDLRKKENERIGKLNQEIDVKHHIDPEKQADPEAVCVICGSSFIWLFNPKVECTVCKSYFCKNKSTCGVCDKLVEGYACLLCHKQKDVEWKSLDWFYARLRNKFRRHGGAKIVREFYKTKKGGDTPPPKPPRLHDNDDVRTEEIRISLTRDLDTIDEVDDVLQEESKHSKVQTTETDSADQHHVIIDQSQMRKEIEDVIASTILPKFEELKATQARDQREPPDSSKLAQEIIERLLDTSSDGNQYFDDETDDNALMRRYLRDHKQSILRAVLIKVGEQDAPPSGIMTNSRSPLRDAETMTDASDSESIQSGSLRSRSSVKTPLSERMRNLSPESLRNLLNTNQLSKDDHRTVVQGTVLKKDQMIARAEVDSAIAQIMDQDEVDQPQEFSTEIKFTAVGVDQQSFGRKSSHSGSDTSESDDVGGENWIVPGKEAKQNGFFKTSSKPSYFPTTDAPSAYDLSASQSDSDDIKIEEVVQPVKVTKEFSEISARSLGEEQREIAEPEPVVTKQRSVCDVVDDDILQELNQELVVEKTYKAESLLLPPIEEEAIVPQSRDVKVLYQSVLPLTSAVAAFQTLSKRPSDDSAYQSDVSVQSWQGGVGEGARGRRINGGEESDTFSSNSSLDGSQRISPKKRSTILVPERDVTRSASPTPAPRLKSNHVILTENKAFDQALSDAIERQDEHKDESLEIEINEEEFENRIQSPGSEKRVRFASENNQVFQGDDLTATDSSTTENDYDIIIAEQKRTAADESAEIKHAEELSDSDSMSGNESETSSSSSGSSLDDKPTNQITSSWTNQEEADGREEKYISTDNEEDMQVKSIDGIIAHLKSAGLSGEKCRVYRSSLHISPVSAPQVVERQWKSQSTPSPKVTPRPDPAKKDWSRVGFTVDPANYKKQKTQVKQVSLTELLEADRSASQSADDLSPRDSDTSTPLRTSVVATPSGPGAIKTSGDEPLTSLPSVVQRRSLFAGESPSPKLNGNKGRRAMTSPKINDDSDSDVSSMMSSSTDRPAGYDADTSTMASDADDESRSITSSEARDSKTSLPDLVNVEKLILKKEMTSPLKSSPVNKPLRELSPLERNDPVRGSITMRGGRMVMTSTPDQKGQITFQERETSSDDSSKRRPFVLHI
uniref:Uncharacterized protein LOC100176041 n=1 Tax=Phallusia mammillata TaxID=59560 RepID=A0A6F9DGE4_9ASCI|nr:uncharacterized protein LOC100176041 [Phallusia mammillata]